MKNRRLNYRGCFVLMVTGLLCCCQLGCQPEEEIAQYQVPKEKSGLQFLRDQQTTAGAANRGELPSSVPADLTGIPDEECTDRMIVGIVIHEDLMWFFKMNGAIEAMEKSEPQWQAFLSAIRFSGSKPIWELPEGWEEGAPRPMRTATLLIPKFSPPLEMAISNLNADQDLLLNVNRWRGQMGQPPINQAQLEKNLQPLQSDTGTGYLFDVKGKFAGGMMPNMGISPAARPAPSPAGLGSGGPKTPRYDIPTGWEMGATSPMVPVRLQKPNQDPPLQMTIVPLPAAVNEWAPNAQRWAGEVDLGNLSSEQLDSFTATVSVDGLPGKVLRLIPPNEDQQRGLIAAMVVQNDTAWFVKLSGEKSVVEQSEEDFQQFLNSLKFSQ